MTTRSCHIYGFVLTWHRDESKKEELSLEPLRCVIYSAFLLKWSKIKSALVAENVLTRSAVTLAAFVASLSLSFRGPGQTYIHV